MSSKMREALRTVISLVLDHNWDELEAVNEIAQRYDDLEFTRDEVRGVARDFLCKVRGYWGDLTDDQTEILDEILSRHTEGCDVAEEEAVKRYGPDWRHDDTPTIKAIEIEQRLAAIEKRLLADGHSEGCGAVESGLLTVYECTCGHDEIRRNKK